MTSDDSCVKVFVFVARDAAEYDKYVLMRGENDEHGKNVGENNDAPSGFSWRFDATSKILRLVINKGSLGLGGWAGLRPPVSVSDFKNVERIAVLLERLRNKSCADEDRVQAKVLIKDVFLGKEGGELRGSLWNVLQGLRDEDGRPVLAGSVQGRIFIHWGGGERDSILFYEQKVTEFLPDNWRLYSLGTNRNHLFLVDGARIYVPNDSLELQELERKFSGESDFLCVRDILTKYVVENMEKHAANSSENTCSRCYTIDKQAQDVRNYLNSIAESCASPLVAKLLDRSKPLQEFLKNEAMEKLPYCDEIGALFSLLIQEDMGHD